jgi:hypothetical protein
MNPAVISWDVRNHLHKKYAATMLKGERGPRRGPEMGVAETMSFFAFLLFVIHQTFDCYGTLQDSDSIHGQIFTML